MKLKSIEYTLSIVGTKGRFPSIFLNPTKHNIDINKKTGHRRFFMNERGLKRFQEFIFKQWENNIIEK